MDQGRVHRKGTFDQLNRVDDLDKEQSSQENISDINDEKHNDFSESDQSFDSDEESITNINDILINLQGIRSLSNPNKKNVSDQLHANNIKTSMVKQN